MEVVNFEEKLNHVNEYWSPKIVGELNDSYVKVVKLKGEFVWHHHDHEDEMFLVIRGSFVMEHRDSDGTEHSIPLNEGEFLIVPRGTEHRPVAAQEVEVLLFEPAGTLNTGNVRDALTADNLQHI